MIQLAQSECPAIRLGLAFMARSGIIWGNMTAGDRLEREVLMLMFTAASAYNSRSVYGKLKMNCAVPGPLDKFINVCYFSVCYT